MEENREYIREKNLIPFKKGESGNPKGRPKGQRDYATIYREALIKIAATNDKTPEEIEEMMEQVGLQKAMKGDFNFFRDIRDRIHGRPMQRTDLTTNGKDLPTPILNVFPNNSNAKDTETEQEG